MRNVGLNISFLLPLALSGVTAGQLDLDQPKEFQAYRSSSYRLNGGNSDRAEVPPESDYTVAQIEGAGRIVHMWFTIATREPDYLQTTRIKPTFLISTSDVSSSDLYMMNDQNLSVPQP